jgi:hypothetical protein
VSILGLSIHQRTTPQVLGTGHYLQVARVAATSIAAKVVKVHPNRDFSVFKNPSNPMCLLHTAMPIERTVAVIRDSTDPIPAAV